MTSCQCQFQSIMTDCKDALYICCAMDPNACMHAMLCGAAFTVVQVVVNVKRNIGVCVVCFVLSSLCMAAYRQDKLWCLRLDDMHVQSTLVFNCRNTHYSTPTICTPIYTTTNYSNPNPSWKAMLPLHISSQHAPTRGESCACLSQAAALDWGTRAHFCGCPQHHICIPG